MVVGNHAWNAIRGPDRSGNWGSSRARPGDRRTTRRGGISPGRNRRRREGGEETVDRIEGEGGSVEFRELDVTDADAVEDVLGERASERGLDVLVNNAGIGHEAAVEETVSNDEANYVTGHGLVFDGGYSIS